MGSANSGINFYAINLVYSGDTPQPVETYTLSYDENGGSGTMEEQTAEDGQSLTVKANTFTAPAGYSFKEWNDNHKGSGTKYNAGQSVTMHADLTLYAVWSPKSYTITLNANGG
ncbi:MAG: InlB B-repeat-containing protein, partial [Paludibacteraceae bacterium]|nr:InlB B-repeat-containing protein [Paludibacteraceae bacterium]